MPEPSRLSRRSLPAARRHVEPSGPPGIVHLGLGNFHRGHQAVYTSEALQAEPGPWGIHAFGNRSRGVVEAMIAQDLLYTVVEISPDGRTASVPGVHSRVDVAADRPSAVVEAIAASSARIVTLTVTEHGYTYSPTTHDLDLADPRVQRDLAEPGSPVTAVGQLSAGLVQRFRFGGESLAVVSCDNLSDNGGLLRRLVATFTTHAAREVPPEFLQWLEDSVSFPSTMVDRIVPATTDHHRSIVAADLGVRDSVPVPTEPFSMWVLEDRFPAGRPAWESAGAIFTDDVEAYELLKLRLLNGTHSLLAYLGVLAGAPTIPEAIGLPYIEQAARRVIRDEYLPTVRVPKAVDVDRYVEQLFHRFSNTALGHRTTQVAADGSQKLPQRLVEPAIALSNGGTVPHLLCLTVAGFLACVAPLNRSSGSLTDQVRDPMRADLERAASSGGSPALLVDSAFDELELLPDRLAGITTFRNRVVELLDIIERFGVEAAALEAVG